LKAARQIASSRAVVTLGAPFDPGHVTHNFDDALDDIETRRRGRGELGGRPVRIGRGFVEDVEGERLEEDEIAGLGRALLVLHAPRDEVVGVENATRIFTAAKHPKSFVTLDDADHLITRGPRMPNTPPGSSRPGRSGTWTSGPPPRRPARPRASRACPRRSRGLPAGHHGRAAHHVLGMSPKSYGGTDRGLTPYQFLAAGLGACTSMTVRMYARRKGWPLDHISVDVTHDKVHAQDAGNGMRPLETFTRVITLEGDLTEDQRERLLEIADKCPVHRTLERGSHVHTRTGMRRAVWPRRAPCYPAHGGRGGGTDDRTFRGGRGERVAVLHRSGDGRGLQRAGDAPVGGRLAFCPDDRGGQHREQRRVHPDAAGPAPKARRRGRRACG
jgi:uncharacterized OsmC-like protein